jgi:hypothetical protein
MKTPRQQRGKSALLLIIQREKQKRPFAVTTAQKQRRPSADNNAQKLQTRHAKA